ncbi:SH2 domain-containing protein [Tieghemostelium lacteum]|uniref:SH2 domain-containing protein n=1 Tax=Tieghemostelium lacteum TaxID=361077 RepID=A0A151Z6Y6_TIELA|nr:SH2 domain-containing protein [Tieghemostelium lacteum]|eukprot:KYQ89723.1 SH2 domain-containing protein [Tieghemostelium lacteum]
MMDANTKIEDIEQAILKLTTEIKHLDIKCTNSENEINSLVDIAISSKNQINNKSKLETIYTQTLTDLKLREEKVQELAKLKHQLIKNLLDDGNNSANTGNKMIDIWSNLKNSSFKPAIVVTPPSQDTGSVVIKDSNIDQAKTQVQTATTSPQVEDEKEMGRWEIDKSDIIMNREAKLGSGAFGSVFKGVVRGKDVAIKKLTQQFFDESVMNEFKKEVILMVKLRNPHLLLFMGACTTPGDLCIVTELMTKGSVHTLLRAKEDSPDFIGFLRAILIARDTALGMNWLHLSNPPILHLDLKPANLLVDNNWVVKVADFGLSKIKQGSSTSGQAGSPLYMAPEMLLNQEYDEKADVFSFGILLWELLTKQEPYNKLYTSYPALVEGVVHKKNRPIIPDFWPTRLKELLNRCWEHFPNKRPSFQNITETKILDQILIDGLISDQNGRLFWQNFLGKESVPWNQFYVTFCNSFTIDMRANPMDDLKMKFLKILLVPVDSENVSIEDFGKFCTWFGPLKTGMDVLERVKSICSIKGFMGDVSSKNASQYLLGKKSGDYLIRFSSEPGCFAISYINKNNELVHSKIIYKQGQGYIHYGGNTHYITLDDLIKTTHKTLSLKNPFVGGSFYGLIQEDIKGPDFNYQLYKVAAGKKGI